MKLGKRFISKATEKLYNVCAFEVTVAAFIIEFEGKKE
jgi:hypothetical protein